LHNLRTCGWQYKLERVDETPSRPSCPQAAGALIHQVTEQIDPLIEAGNARESVQQLADNLLAEIEPEITTQFSDHFTPETWKSYGRPTIAKPNGEDWEWWKACGLPATLNSFLDWRYDNPQWGLATLASGELAIEVPFNYTVEGVEVRGYIDRVMVNKLDGGLCLFDYKTGRKPQTDEQLAFYAKATGIQFGAYLYGMKSGPTKFTGPIDLSHWSHDKLKTLVTTGDSIIKQQLFMPNAGEACFHCSVQSACVFYQSAI
jgi:hypothetical protein